MRKNFYFPGIKACSFLLSEKRKRTLQLNIGGPMKKFTTTVFILVLGIFLTSGIMAGEKKQTKIVKIKGMMCSACEAKVKQALLKVEGVESAVVNHRTGEAKIVLASDKVDLKKIDTVITDAGFKPISYDGKTTCELGICDCPEHQKSAKHIKQKAPMK